MVEDIYEPLDRYDRQFREKFDALAVAKFNEFTQRSGIDIKANDRQVRLVEKLRTQSGSIKLRRSFAVFFAVTGGLAAGATVLYILSAASNDVLTPRAVLILIASAAFAIWMSVVASKLGKKLRLLDKAVESQIAEAWKQMLPLNRLYTWDMTVRMIEETVPRLNFDPFFSVSRLEALKRLYGWPDAFNENRSMLFAQSGSINGNPFVFGEYLEMHWTEEIYHGSLEISWTERETDINGKSRWVHHHETLRASVAKPRPEYVSKKFLLYGNDAAPNLSFSREPSNLSGAEDGFFTELRKKRRLKKLEKHSRNLDDDSNFTLMGNGEFEVLFHAIDRTDEVEFRLLYTPIAQLQTLKLLKDKTVGFGDDFNFCKCGKLNVLTSKHLDEGVISTDPAQLYDWNWRRARENFRAFNNAYFKNIYFSFAPLLSIPLYQQVRSHEELWKEVIPGEPSSFWEHEAIANYHGEKYFAHADCITRSIIKTSVKNRSGGVGDIQVRAHGYRGECKVEYVTVSGGDGRNHRVPVEWIEYLPVTGSGMLRICEGDRTKEFASSFKESSVSAVRRSIFSYVYNR